ncbi:MAG: hypothetical protein ACP5I3_11520 [Thermoproteus sp.]
MWDNFSGGRHGFKSSCGDQLVLAAGIWRARRLLKASAQKAAAAVALALATACGRTSASVYAWRGTPDVVLDRRTVELRPPVFEEDAVRLAEVFKYGADGAVVEVEECSLGVPVEVEAYADPRVPKEAAILDREAAVVVEPETGDLLSILASGGGREWLNAAFGIMRRSALTLATCGGPERYRLDHVVSWIKASGDWSLDPRRAAPLVPAVAVPAGPRPLRAVPRGVQKVGRPSRHGEGRRGGLGRPAGLPREVLRGGA